MPNPPPSPGASLPPPPRGLLDALARRPLVLDAAMGTRLIAQGLRLDHDDPCLWNLARPEAVLALHQADIAAGADVILTNTFGASATTLARCGRAHDVRAVIRAGAGLAREAAGPGRFVLGSMGPAALHAPGAYRAQAEALLEAGVHGLVLETHTYQGAVDAGLPALRGLTNLPIVISILDHDRLAGAWGQRLVELGASVLGSNCQLGMEPMLSMARSVHRLGPHVPLLAKPSAALTGQRAVSPQAFAAAVPELVALGVRLIGGCCGSTHLHVAAVRAALETAAPARVTCP